MTRKGTELSVKERCEAVISSPLALYIHIPFCETKCPYCDFNTYARIEPLIPSYVDALCTEIRIWGDLLSYPSVQTVFFGGGTPSYLSVELIDAVMTAVRSAFRVAKKAEVTLEANPGDLSEQKLATYLEIGINRLSIGIQSFSDRLLEILGRRHSAAQAVQAYRLAAQAGFDNISIDLMYGLPHQTMGDWTSTLEVVGELVPSHVSMYCLTLEDGTVLHQWVMSARMPDPDADLAADMYLMAQQSMKALGYRQYEISNWARLGSESRHNLTYWLNKSYLGVGPGSHSYLPPFRFSNLKSPREYIRKLQAEFSMEGLGSDVINVNDIRLVPTVEGVERINRRLEMAETLMMGLRLDAGVSINEFVSRFGLTPVQAYGAIIDEVTSLDLLECSKGRLRLTPRGMMLGNEVFSRFFG